MTRKKLFLIIIICTVCCIMSAASPAAKQTVKGMATDTAKPIVRDLQELVVKYKKQKYNKHNPASALMLRIRGDHEKVAPENINGYSYDSYEKITVGIADTNGDGREFWIIPVKDRTKLNQLIDTAPWTGTRVLNISLKEKSSVNIYQGNRRVEIVNGTHNEGLDKKFSSEYTSVAISDAMREVNLYEDDIYLLRNKFVSPLSKQGINFYHYELQDTVMIGEDLCVELSFAPAVPEMTGFNGRLYIPVKDSVKYVRRAMMRLPKAANVNFVKSLILSQNFRKDSLGKVHKVIDDMFVDLQLAPLTPIFAFNRQTRRNEFGYEGREGYESYLESIGTSFSLEGADDVPEEFWKERRLMPLSAAERNMAGANSVFRKDKLFYWCEAVIHAIARDFIPTGYEKRDKFEIGPLHSLLSYSHMQGWRMQLGGMTTANLFPHFFLRGYLAWSFGDHKWKGAAEGEYSFEKRKLHAREFPMNNIKAGWSYDIYKLGSSHSSFGDASIWKSWQRSNNDFVNYWNEAYIEYSKEWRNNLSFNVGFRYTRCMESPTVKFIDGFGRMFGHLDQGAFTATVRWAPNEKFIQTLNGRVAINRDPWVMSLNFKFSPKGLMGGRFNIFKTEFDLTKTFWLSAYGYIEVSAKASKIWTQVPFTELSWQDANTSYMYEPRSFSLLNPMEFAMDEYVNWSFTYFMNGLIFNHIPLIKKAKIREVVGFKGFWGHLSRRNDPSHSTNVLKFPNPSSVAMGSTPYMECSVGLENILRLFSIHYTWRLTYRNRPDISHGGLQWGMHFNF